MNPGPWLIRITTSRHTGCTPKFVIIFSEGRQLWALISHAFLTKYESFCAQKIGNFLNLKKIVLLFILAKPSGPQWPFFTSHSFFPVFISRSRVRQQFLNGQWLRTECTVRPGLCPPVFSNEINSARLMQINSCEIQSRKFANGKGKQFRIKSRW